MISILYSLIYKLLYFLTKGIRLKGFVYRSRVLMGKGNHVKSIGRFVRSKLTIQGKNNIVEIKGSVCTTYIHIEGDCCEIVIEDGVEIYGKEILVRGDHAKIFVGKNTRINSGCRLICQGNHNSIFIASDCLFSNGVNIWNSDTHTIYDFEKNIINLSRPVVIGRHVWFGSNCAVLKGVSIGEDSIIGMHAVVTKSVPHNSIVAGNPAKVIKSRISWDKAYIKDVSL